jgi:hypothetical protein
MTNDLKQELLRTICYLGNICKEDCTNTPYDECQESKLILDKILSHPRILVKAENQELPAYIGSPDSSSYDDLKEGYLEAQQDMVKEGWVKVEKK